MFAVYLIRGLQFHLFDAFLSINESFPVTINALLNVMFRILTLTKMINFLRRHLLEKMLPKGIYVITRTIFFFSLNINI